MLSRWGSALFLLAVCLLPALKPAQAQIRTEFVGSPGSGSLFLTQAPGDTNRAFVVRQNGRIELMDLTTGAVNATPYLDVGSEVIASGERGLLGLAFHPDFQSNGLFYVNMSVPQSFGGDHDTLIREYQAADPTSSVASPVSTRTVLRFSQDFDNHNGGWLGFNPIANAANDNDQYLYIGVGDGGDANDPFGRSQDRTQILGNILRINPTGTDANPGDSNKNYAIPSSNPFVGNVSGFQEEIWSWGLRNPWRNSFDKQTGDLYIADVGQNLMEEINFQSASSAGGENYGWDIREGTNGSALPGSIDPVYEYTHGFGQFQGRSLTGGYVYRGPVQGLQGKYFFADFVSNNIWSIEIDSNTGLLVPGSLTDWTQAFTTDSGNTITSITSFGEDNAGNLYIITGGGDVFTVVPEPSTCVLCLVGMVVVALSCRRMRKAHRYAGACQANA